MGTALGVETVYPFLSPRVASLALSFPDGWHRESGFSKPVLREICAQLVSSDVAYWGKMGFPSPTYQWLDGPLGENLRMMREADDFLDTVIPRDMRQLLNSRTDFELTWTLMNLQSVGRSIGLH